MENPCSTNTGFPHVHPAKDGRVKSTGCPHEISSSMAKKGAFLPTDIAEEPQVLRNWVYINPENIGGQKMTGGNYAGC